MLKNAFEKFGQVLSISESELLLKNLWEHIKADSRVSLLLEQLGVSLRGDSSNEIDACLSVRFSLGTVQGWV